MCCIFAALLSLGAAQDDMSKVRKWTNTKGKTVSAQLVRVNGDKLTLKLGNGKVAQVPKTAFSQKDNGLLNQWLKKNPSGFNVPDGPFKWPQVFRGKDGFNVKYIRFDEKREAHLYETEYFNFFCEEKLSHTTLWECISIFYNVAIFLESLPIHLECLPKAGEDKYDILLVATARAYAKLGGPPNSGGFYDPQRHLTVIPYSSLGLVKQGKVWKFDKQKRDYTTLLHELVHHFTYKKWQGLPCWLEEGMADFIAMTPYKGNEFRLYQPGKNISDELNRLFGHGQARQIFMPGGKYAALPLTYIFKVDRGRWNGLLSVDNINGGRQYHTSAMVFYYFAFLDGKKDGSHLIQYMHAQRKGYRERKCGLNDDKMIEKYLLRGRSYEALQTEMEQAFAKNKLDMKFHRGR